MGKEDKLATKQRWSVTTPLSVHWRSIVLLCLAVTLMGVLLQLMPLLQRYAQQSSPFVIKDETIGLLRTKVLQNTDTGKVSIINQPKYTVPSLGGLEGAQLMIQVVCQFCARVPFFPQASSHVVEVPIKAVRSHFTALHVKEKLGRVLHGKEAISLGGARLLASSLVAFTTYTPIVIP